MSYTLGKFLKELDRHTHSRYIVDKYTRKSKKPRCINTITDSKPKFKTEENILSKHSVKLSSMDKDHPVVEYCSKRKIPEKYWKEIYYCDDFQSLVKDFKDKYSWKNFPVNEGRLIFPLRTRTGELIGLNCRAVKKSNLRYITLKIDDDAPKVFGLDRVDITKDVYVIEGPIDSLFIDNAIGMSGASIDIESLGIPKNKLVFVFDNEPRNRDIIRAMNNAYLNGYRVVVFPKNIKENDINDMVLGGISIPEINELLRNNSYTGLKFKLTFTNWKK